MAHVVTWLLAFISANSLGANGVKLNVSEYYPRKPIPLEAREGVVGSQCYDEMKPGLPVLAYLRRAGGMPYKALWERTFLKELLRDVGDVLICDIHGNAGEVQELFRRSGDSPVGFIVAGYPQQMALVDLEEPVQKSAKKPVVLFHFSDESGKYKPTYIYPRIMPHDGLVLRQYQFWSELPAAPQTRIMPLGYNMHLDFQGDSCAAAKKNALGGPSSRSYNWAFVGGMHATPWGDRASMVSDLLGRRFAAADQLDSKEAFVGQRKGTAMFEVYRQSVFAPNLPGAKNNECFRVYESAIAGAIPVIVGEEDEIQRAYNYHADPSWSDKRPPFVFAPTWADARTQMSRLLENPGELEALHAQLPAWYCSWMHGLQQELAQKLSR
ncbi:unnamed protein product [Prorocentrum cordatum]|uniref:RXYLT1 C-terminal domain-containing protein n=1 Tax=Prorocentrum cordatum TaxID=2364126 RepID=A0ABN9TPF5_9DINO|nr:unnamed protein product [Polarella glacialis]|mmetsp:Transcript_90467/g.235552  ORF Transcript_90467/g.235552 Transcript_90467/m.235552 type:complete len:382 (-) Transcript_90467:35-1180(-)